MLAGPAAPCSTQQHHKVQERTTQDHKPALLLLWLLLPPGRPWNLQACSKGLMKSHSKHLECMHKTLTAPVDVAHGLFGALQACIKVMKACDILLQSELNFHAPGSAQPTRVAMHMQCVLLRCLHFQSSATKRLILLPFNSLQGNIALDFV